MTEQPPLLEVSGLSVRYGAVTAVRGVDLSVGEGEIVSVVGPNGAGKTSLLAAIAGIVPAAAGRIVFAGNPLAGTGLEEIVARGLALVMNLCERIQVLDSGRTIAAGTPAQIRADANVRRAYLGSHSLQ